MQQYIVQKCKHPIEKIVTTKKDEYSEDEYGSGTTWTTYFLECSKCKKRVELGKHWDQVLSPEEKHYEKLTGRELDLTELKKVFKLNNKLFHKLQGLNSKLVKEVKANPRVEKALEEKRKLINKHRLEYLQMLREFNGGHLDTMLEVEESQLDGSFDRFMKQMTSR